MGGRGCVMHGRMPKEPCAHKLSPSRPPQVLGPEGQLLMQHSRDASCSWADPASMAFGACYAGAPGGPRGPPSGPGDGGMRLSGSNGRGSAPSGSPPSPIMPPGEFDSGVRLGFQATDTLHQGRLRATEPDGDLLQGAEQAPNTAPGPSRCARSTAGAMRCTRRRGRRGSGSAPPPAGWRPHPSSTRSGRWALVTCF